MHQHSIKYRSLFFLVAFIVFVYVVIRAIYVPAVIDEVLTFFWYVKTGRMQPGYSYLDANNHILNSALSHICFNIFGDGIFVIRIPTLIGFIIYATYGYKIYVKLENPFAKIVWLVLIFCTQYILDFFSVSRGYGMSFGFLMGVFYYLIHQFTTEGKKGFTGGVICNILMIFSNLALLTWSPALLMCSLFLFFKNKRNIRQYMMATLGLILYTLVFVYLYNYATLLQKQEKIYLFGGETFYEVIYKGLSVELGLGSFAMGQLLVVSLLVLLFLLLLANLRKMGLKEVFLIVGFIGFNIGFILLHTYMKVNYPPDRSSIQIYLLLILTYVFILNKNKGVILNILGCIPAGFLLYFFISHVQITHNNHWISEAVPHSFVKKVAELNKPRKVPYSVGIHVIDGVIWDYYSYLNDYTPNFGRGHNGCDSISDILVISGTRKDVCIPMGYDTLAIHSPTSYLLLMKKNPQSKYMETPVPDIHSSEEFIGLQTFNLDSSKTGSINAAVEFELVESGISQEAILVFSTQKEYASFDLKKIRKNKQFKMSVSVPIHAGDTHIHVYIRNPEETKFVIKHITVYIEI